MEAPRFAAVGTNVTIDPTALFYGAEHISIGSNVRIDAHAIVTGGAAGVRIGDHVHIGAGAQLFGTAGLELCDFSGVSPRASIFTTNDDYTEGWLTGPTVPDELRKVHGAPVRLGPHAVVGAGSVVLPGVTFGKGAMVGSLSLVRRDVEPFVVVAGNPARPVSTRDRARLEELEQQMPGR